jgi:hypothetical protein
VEVITKNGQEIHGRLDRIGSPSEDNDLLLFAAKRKMSEEDYKPLGETYHHYRDISQVRFPEMEPSQPDKRGNWLIGSIVSMRLTLRKTRQVPMIIRYRYYYYLYRHQILGEDTNLGRTFHKVSRRRDNTSEQDGESDLERAVKTAKSLKQWFDK